MTRVHGDDAAVLEAPRNLICALGRAEGRRLEADAARRPRRRARGLPLWKRRRRRVRRLKCFQLLQRRVALGACGVVVRGYISLALGRVDRGGVARHFATVLRGAGVVAHVAVRRLGARRFLRRHGARRSPLATVHVARASFFAGVSMRLFACQSSTAGGWRRAAHAVMCSASSACARRFRGGGCV